MAADRRNHGLPHRHQRLAPSIACVPHRLRGNPPDNAIAPDPTFQRAWSGTFSGSLITPTAYTKFDIYTNQSLFPGWQRDPCVAAGQFVPATCPNGNWDPKETNDNPPTKIWPAGNTIAMQVWYDFDSDGTPDRIEWYLNLPLDSSNAWSYASKLTEYGTNAPWPNVGPPVIPGGLTGTANKPFPASIPSDKPATVTLYLYGGSNQEDKNGKILQFDVPVSVNTSTLTNRASWLQPPYQPLTGLMPPRKLYFPWMMFQRPRASDVQTEPAFAQAPGR